jgi:transposase
MLKELKYVLGIDVSKATLDYCLRERAGRILAQGKVANSPTGLDELLKIFTENGVTATDLHAVMEATGHYGNLAFNFLHQQGVVVSVVNPTQIKHFGRSLNVRTKNDRVDARIIARFGAERSPRQTLPIPASEAALREIMREIEALTGEKTQCQNRLDAVAEECVRQSLRDRLDFIEKQIALLQDHAKKVVAGDPQLQEKVTLLDTIPGIAVTTAMRVVSEIAGKNFESARDLAAYAGLTPAEHTSGSSVRGKTRLSKIGNTHLRKALYMPAQSARRFCAPLKAWGDELLTRGKAKKAVIGAVMRKLIHIIFGVLSHQTPFDPKKAAIPQFSH